MILHLFMILSFFMNTYNNYLLNAFHFRGIHCFCKTSPILPKREIAYYSGKDKNSSLYTNNRHLITISPGGFKGFWMLGVSAYIKEHYASYLTNCSYSGASAGSWIALFMTFKGDDKQFISNIIDDEINRLKIINEIKYRIKHKILSSYNESNFDLSKIYIGVYSLQEYKLMTHIYSKFDNLEDVLECCIASSHIPFITGGMTQKYHDIVSYDGGFSKYPYTNFTKPILHITSDMFSKNAVLVKRRGILESIYYTSLFAREKYNFTHLFHQGYQDAEFHKEYLDTIFYSIHKNKEIDTNNNRKI